MIVILAILCAFALPLFADLGRDARLANLEGAAGSVRSAAAIAHSAWLARSEPDNPLILEGGVEVTMSEEGYPTRNAEGIGAAAQLDDNDFTFGAFGGGGPNRTVEIGLTDGPDSCLFKYNPSNGTVSGLESADCQ